MLSYSGYYPFDTVEEPVFVQTLINSHQYMFKKIQRSLPDDIIMFGRHVYRGTLHNNTPYNFSMPSLLVPLQNGMIKDPVLKNIPAEVSNLRLNTYAPELSLFSASKSHQTLVILYYDPDLFDTEGWLKDKEDEAKFIRLIRNLSAGLPTAYSMTFISPHSGNVYTPRAIAALYFNPYVVLNCLSNSSMALCFQMNTMDKNGDQGAFVSAASINAEFIEFRERALNFVRDHFTEDKLSESGFDFLKKVDYLIPCFKDLTWMQYSALQPIQIRKGLLDYYKSQRKKVIYCKEECVSVDFIL